MRSLVARQRRGSRQVLAFSSLRSQSVIPGAGPRIRGLLELRAAPIAGAEGAREKQLGVEVRWGDREIPVGAPASPGIAISTTTTTTTVSEARSTRSAQRTALASFPVLSPLTVTIALVRCIYTFTRIVQVEKLGRGELRRLSWFARV